MRKQANQTVECVDHIRSELKKTNSEIQQVNARLDETNGRLEALRAHTNAGFAALERRMVESGTRTAMALAEMAAEIKRNLPRAS